MTAPRRLSRIPVRHARRVAAPLRRTGNFSPHPSRFRPPPASRPYASGPGGTAGPAETARISLSAGGDADIGWDFPLGELPAERPRLAALRAPAP